MTIKQAANRSKRLVMIRQKGRFDTYTPVVKGTFYWDKKATSLKAFEELVEAHRGGAGTRVFALTGTQIKWVSAVLENGYSSRFTEVVSSHMIIYKIRDLITAVLKGCTKEDFEKLLKAGLLTEIERT